MEQFFDLTSSNDTSMEDSIYNRSYLFKSYIQTDFTHNLARLKLSNLGVDMVGMNSES